MKLLSKGPWVQCRPLFDGTPLRKREVRYSASFYDSDTGRRFEKSCDDVLYDRGGKPMFLNTAPNVSYFSALAKACQ